MKYPIRTYTRMAAEIPGAIADAFREAPRTMTLAALWVVVVIAVWVYIFVSAGWWALLWLAGCVVLGIALSGIKRWAAKHDGIEP